MEVPQSPIRVHVKPHVDVSKVKVDGLEPSKLIIPIVETQENYKAKCVHENYF